jgi:sugar/nucleoside kinase (ribokinase family)
MLFTVYKIEVQVRYTRGGVGRNIAECLGRLGHHPFLISVVGDDMEGW